MSVFNEHQFEKRLQLLKDSQESIQTLSTWCLQHRQHHKKIVATWLKILKKVKVEHRVTLFYLANDVIQYSKRKNYEFVESWGTALQRATTMVREEKVKSKILRIFQVWDDRGIYDEAFITDLRGLISTSTKKTTTQEPQADPVDFQPNILYDKIRSCKTLEDDTDLKLKKLNDSHLSLSDVDALRTQFKDRRQGDDMVAEVDCGISKMEAYIHALEVEMKERAVLIDLLEQGENFYNTQKGEARVVANAYRNFGSRVKNLKRRLDEMIPTLKEASPIPSPDVNAPSPSPDSDIELPGENNTTELPSNSFLNDCTSNSQPTKAVGTQDEQSVDKGFTSFIGNSLPFDLQKNLFSEASQDAVLSSSSPETPLEEVPIIPGLSSGNSEPEEKSLKNEENSLGKPIEVINSRSKPEETFNITEFLKSLIPSSSSSTTAATAIPGLTLDEDEPQPEPAPLEKQISYTSDTEIQSASNTDYDYPPLSTSSSPLQPPPMPPNLFPLEETTTYKYETNQENEDSWNTKLPPKFPTWSDTNPAWQTDSGEKVSEWMPVLPVNKVPIPDLDTPESPPMYEKEGFSDPVEYDDSVANSTMISASADVDHRTLVPLPLASAGAAEDPAPLDEPIEDTDHRLLMPVPAPNHNKKDVDHRAALHRKKDIDHRNLISLTGSPVRDTHAPLAPPPTPPVLSWLREDQDYRAGKIVPTLDNSAEKEVSSDGDVDYRKPSLKGVPHKNDEVGDVDHNTKYQKQSSRLDTNIADDLIPLDDTEQTKAILMSPLQNRDDSDDSRTPTKTLSHKRDETQDNVESVDMEMSDEEFFETNENVPSSSAGDGVKLDEDIVPLAQVTNKTVSFNINNQSKVLFNSPLNEGSEDSPKTRNRVYGCHKIPTIGGSAPAPAPRLRNTPPPNVTSPRSSVRSALLAPPPPPPPLPPPPLPTETSRGATSTTTVGIASLCDLLSANAKNIDVAESAETYDIRNGQLKDTETHIENNNLSRLSDDAIWSSLPDLEALTELLNSSSGTSPGSNSLNVSKDHAEWIEDAPAKTTESNGTGSGIETIVTASNNSLVQKPPDQPWCVPVFSTNENEPWINDEVTGFESHDPLRAQQSDRGRMMRGRGMGPLRGFQNPPPPGPPGPPMAPATPSGSVPPPLIRGPFNLRMRPGWSGPRRNVPPPPRFPFRPPHDPNVGRGFFRPFRGNMSRPYGGGW